MKIYIRLIRLNQWAKNLLLFAPLFFAGHFTEVDLFINAVYGFVLFSLLASSIYIFNDYNDIEKDRLHPVKKNRPLASGEISIRSALMLALFLFVGSLSMAWLLNPVFFYILLTYGIINILYSLGMKNLSLLDIFIVSSGFVLRVYAGGVLTATPVSQWLFIMSFLLALFIAFAKRRDDVLIKLGTGVEIRTAVKGYNLEFISSSISILCGILVVTYLLYVTSPDVEMRFPDKPIYISALFVLLGILRYLQITLVDGKSGSPTRVFYTDRFIQIVLLLWVMFFVFLIYL
ncbi:MAG: prenyltransferase [Bacteroidetes bacterium]|nr:MAG: prenyltransferase [Bacteroidota bacterium]